MRPTAACADCQILLTPATARLVCNSCHGRAAPPAIPGPFGYRRQRDELGFRYRVDDGSGTRIAVCDLETHASFIVQALNAYVPRVYP